MKHKSAIVTCAFVLPAFMVIIMQNFNSIPIWSLVVAWACFFHLGGDKNPSEASKLVLINLLLGILSGWTSALLIVNGPAFTMLNMNLWAPLVIGLAIGVITVLSLYKNFIVPPVVIYGFSINWAYLSSQGMLNQSILTQFSLQNVLISTTLSILLGCLFGYINSISVKRLSLE